MFPGDLLRSQHASDQRNLRLALQPALRCGVVHADDPRRITLYAGCGIVEESDPGEEFAETEAKLMPMLEALGVPATQH